MIFMKYLWSVALLAALVGLWPAAPACAYAIAAHDLPDLLLRADVVCVGTVGAVQVGPEARFGAGVYSTPAGSKTQEVMLTARKATAEFTVERFLKGSAPSSDLRIAFPIQAKPAVGVNAWYPLTQFVQGERVIVFLTRPPAPTTDGARLDPTLFSLFAPFSLAGDFADPSECGPKIVLGPAPLPDLSRDATPLRRTLRVLTAALADGDRAVRLRCLGRIEGTVGLVAVPADTSGMRVNFAETRSLLTSLGEPQSSTFDAFVANTVLPAVKSLLADPDPLVRERAVFTAAALQDTAMIPRVAVIARRVDPRTGIGASYEVGGAVAALGDFRTTASVRPLTLLLKDSSWKVRERAAYALRFIGDSRSVPALLGDLGDTNHEALYMVVTALYEATGEDSGLPDMDEFHKDEARYVGHWRQWAADHQVEVRGTTGAGGGRKDAILRTPTRPGLHTNPGATASRRRSRR
jgi:hypothetical protein